MKQILLQSENVFSFLQKYDDLYHFWTNALFNYTNFNDIKLKQGKFLKDLMNGFEVYRKYTKPKDFNAGDLYLLLLRNQKYTVNNIFLKTPTDKHKEIYLQAKILFNLREKFFTRLFNKGIIKSNSDQSGIKYYRENKIKETRIRHNLRKSKELK